MFADVSRNSVAIVTDPLVSFSDPQQDASTLVDLHILLVDHCIEVKNFLLGFWHSTIMYVYCSGNESPPQLAIVVRLCFGRMRVSACSTIMH